MRNFQKIISVFILSTLIACSVKYHEQKFYKKGGTFTCEPVKEIVYDTIFEDGDTILVPKDSIVYKPRIDYVPKYVYRYKYLERKAELKAQTKQNKINKKAEVKIVKSNNKAETKQHKQTQKTKRNKWWVFILIGIGIGLVLKSVINFFLNKLKTIL